MARMPLAQWLGAHHDNGEMSRYDIVCIHTIVGFAPAHAAQFSIWADGRIGQSRDSIYRSAANFNGNPWIIAVENEDHGPAFGNWNTNDGHAVPGFTAAQIEANAQVCAWAHRTHGIPLVACPDSKPGSRGIAYHRQGIDSPNNFAGYAYRGRVAGGVLWTKSAGKVCPGDRRIAQIPQIIQRARVIAGLDEENDLTPEESNALMSVYKAVFSAAGGPLASNQGDQSLIQRLVELQGNARLIPTLRSELAGLRAAFDLLAARVDTGEGATPEELRAAAKAGTLEALAEGVVEVDVSVSNKTGV